MRTAERAMLRGSRRWARVRRKKRKRRAEKRQR
jgi:hypothetical protein